MLSKSRITSRIEVFDIVSSGSPVFQAAVDAGRVLPDGANFHELPQRDQYEIINDVIRIQSTLTCAVFLTMPHVDSEPEASEYLTNLDILTAGLPPST